MGKRVIRSVLELAVAIALIVFVFSLPTKGAGPRYLLGSVVVLLFCLSLLSKWP